MGLKWILFLFSAVVLGLSGFAGWFFFGGPEEDPTRRLMQAHIARIETGKREAETGNLRAQFELARLYQNGAFIDPDPGAAYLWFSKAAKKGHAGAQFSLGTLYAKGEGVRQDYYRAAEWYRLAANMGRHAGARFELGNLYFKGRGVANGYAEALGWYKKAAGQGHPVAQHMLGSMYAEGWAGAFDPVEAYKWFTLAMARQKQVMAYDAKFDPMAARDFLARDMNENQLKRATLAAENWRPVK